MGRILRWIAGTLLVLTILVVAAGAAGYWWLLSQPKNFDECMIAGMRGIDSALLPNVQALCERRFFVQIERTPPAGQWNWSIEDGKILVSLLTPFSSLYKASRAIVRVSSKDCEISNFADFGEPITLHGADIFLEGFGPSDAATCMRLESVWVTHR